MPDPTDATPAASSAAADSTPAGSDALDLDAMSESQLHDWRMTGARPDSTTPTDATPPAASSAATPDADPAASTDVTEEPAPEAGTPRADPRATENRVPELLADRSRERARAEKAERELADLRARSAQPPTDARPAASSPAAATTSTLVKPDPETFAYGTADPEYLEALTDYKVAATLEKERTTRDKADADARAADTQRQTIAAFETRAANARLKHPDFDAVALLAPTEIPQGSPADLLILEDEHGAEILYHLQRPEHAAERRRILALAPLAQIKELVRLGDRLTAPDPAARSTSAPPPPAALRTRATPADAVERALAEDDTAAYNAAMNRRDLARLKP